MAIDLKQEKECELSAQDRYDIIDAAVACSYDNGFMNSFIFSRALYNFAFAAFSETDNVARKELFINITSNPLLYWEEHLDEIEDMQKQHVDALNVLADDANTWFADYTEYAYSTRGMLDNLGDIMNGVTQKAQDELLAMQQDGELQSVFDIAQEWGLNNGQTTNIINTESLFADA